MSPSSTPQGFGPADLDSAYNLPSSGGAGTTVAIVDAYDDPNAESDLATYRQQYGLPACSTANGCFKKVSQTGSTTVLPSPDSGWAGEIALDLDMVSAACPNCSILLVEGTSASDLDLDAAENYASAHAQLISNSYGGSESSSDPSESAYNHPGVLILASTGDGGYGVEFPAASPTVLAVGGTSLVRSASGSRGWAETAWGSATDADGGAGSGCSVYETQPSWQTSNATISGLCSRRAVADVSAVADPNTGVAVYDTYGGSSAGATGWEVYGGTSASSPLMAGIFALTGQASDTPQFPYANPADFNDVTSGENGTCGNALCQAQAGWDGPTGIGTPNGTLMAAGSTPPPPPPSNDFSIADSPTGGSVVAGSGASSTVSTTVTSGAAESVSLSVSGAPSGVTASVTPTAVTSGTNSTLSIATTSATTPGTYPLTITGTAASGSHSATYSLTVTAPVVTCTTTTQKLVNPGFESGPTGWRSTASVIYTDGAHSHTGKGYAWLDGYGREHTDTLSQTVSVPSTACSATLSFWLHVNTRETSRTTAYDKLTVTAGGTTLASFSNLNATSGYLQKSYDLSAFKGQTVTVTFKGVEDRSLATSFFIDDNAVKVVT